MEISNDSAKKAVLRLMNGRHESDRHTEGLRPLKRAPDRKCRGIAVSKAYIMKDDGTTSPPSFFFVWRWRPMATKIKAASFIYEGVLKRLERDGPALEKAMQATAKDLKRRLPGKVADDVRTMYNIKKSDVMPTKIGKAPSGARRAGSVTIKGDTIADMALIYRGRVLTPVRFNMSPKAPPPPKNLPEKGPGARKHRKLKGSERSELKKRRRKIKATVIKGQRKVIHSKAFLIHTGGAGRDKVQYIPVIRTGPRPNKDKAAPVEAKKTVSVPQMVRNAKVRPLIQQDLDKLVRERLAHNVRRFKKPKA